MKTTVKNVLFALFVAVSISAIGQNNPFEKFGYTPGILTLSNGEFEEFFDSDTIVQIGSALYNTKSKHVIGFIEKDTIYSETTLEPEIVSRWLSPDPLAAKYPQLSPYNFVLNNPINAIDPDGKDVYLVIWKSEENKTGHAAIAVDNYKKVEKTVIENGLSITKTDWVKDGTVTYFDLWPKKPVSSSTELQDNVTADYNKRIVSMVKLLDGDPSPSGEVGNVSEMGEAQNPDGIVKINSSRNLDEKIKTYMTAVQKVNEPYNACDNNCSTFSEKALKIFDKTFDSSQEVKPGGVLGLIYNDTRVVAPNNLFNRATELKGSTVIKGPSKLDAKPYLQYFGKSNRTD